ncbi:oligosaccharide flippase family protein [Mesorhizobium sp. C280B]|uniref:lipopolysaccharide biosynthesis protein n=1 Tax=unclassified Mesorhizobium TaxID=325217 RepID=UPI0003CF2E41|nr:oligosaccharide flippase family protein [Mesorhizobium sp. LSJC280B00]ESW80502.1 hypothetical protein X772_25025 [Mesorhizobium sp. LSJC280B00]
MNRRSYLRSLGTLIGGSTLAQLVNFASYPFIARTYSPENFGVFALFITLTAIVGSVSCLRFEMMIPSSEPKEQFSVFIVAQCCNAFVSIALVVSLAMLSAIGVLSTGFYFLFFVGVVVALTGLTNAAAILLLQNDKYAARTGSLLLRAIVTVAAQIALGVLGNKETGLIEGFCLGFVAQAIVLVYSLNSLDLNRQIKRTWLKRVIARYGKTVVFDIPSTLISALAINAMSVLISLSYSIREVGLYSISFRIAALPLSLVANGLSEVYFQKASASHRNKGSFLWEFNFTLWTSIALSVAVVAAYALFSKLAVLILGAKWAESGGIVLILLPLLTARLVAVSVQTTALVVRKTIWLLANNILVLGVMLLAVILANVFQYDFKQYLVANSLGCSFAYFSFVVFLYVKVKSYHGP